MFKKIYSIPTVIVIGLASTISFLSELAQLYDIGSTYNSEVDMTIKGTTAGVECNCFTNTPSLRLMFDNKEMAESFKDEGKTVVTLHDEEGEYFIVENVRFYYVNNVTDIHIYPNYICIIPEGTEMIDKRYMDGGSKNYSYYYDIYQDFDSDYIGIDDIFAACDQ